ncbi:MAG: hypothetical protein IKV21_06635, partial [Clostridia bacterium]|nr:hypothetical protein [Clostridia bacterium]
MKYRNKIKGILSVFLTVIFVCLSAVPCLAAVKYPDNVTKEQVYSTIGKADKAIKGLMESQNISLQETVLKEIYSDEVLSTLLIEIYKAIEAEAGTTLSTVGIDTTVSGLAEALSEYPSVAEKLSTFASWEETDLSGAKWNVSSKADFGTAVSEMLSPFDEVLYALLCSGSFSVNLLLGIKGSNGYETAIIPTLQAFGCREYLSPKDFYAQAEKDKGSMIYNIVYDLITFAEKAMDTPCDSIATYLPSIAYYFTNGGFDSAVSTLIEPLTLQVLNIAPLVPVESLSSFISDSESFTQDFTLNINDMLSQTGIPMAPVDLKLMASLGTVNEDGTVTADKADAFMVALDWIIETLKLNQASLGEFIPDMDEQMTQIASAVLSKKTDELISLIVSLFNQSGAIINDTRWGFPEYKAAQVTYTPNLTAEKYMRVADNVDELLNQIVAEMTEEKSVSSIIKKEIYSSKTMSLLLKTLFGTFESESLSSVTEMIGIDTSTSGVAALLERKGFGTAAASLRRCSSWGSIGEEGIDLGIKTGNQKQFISVLASVLSPFNDILGMLLAEDSYLFFDAVELYGSNGYNTAIIPIYEALGCEDSTIRTHEEFKALYNKGKGIEALLDPLVSLLDRIVEKPVYTVLQILPNLLYFMQSGGLKVCIDNLMYPFTGILSQLGVELSIDLSAVEGIDVNALAAQLISTAGMDVTLPTVDIAYFASLGTAVEKTSKRTVSGENATVTYIQSDMPALCVTLLRIMAQALKAPENSSLISTLMETAGETMGE